MNGPSVSHNSDDEPNAPLDVDAIRERVEWRRTMGGRSPDVHPTLLAMEQDIDTLLAERDRLGLEAQECLDCRERDRLREALRTVRDELSNGLTANWDLINKQWKALDA